MKNTSIRTHVLEAGLSERFAYSRAWYDTRMAMIVEIETDKGLIGWGKSYGPAWMTSAAVKPLRHGYSAKILSAPISCGRRGVKPGVLFGDLHAACLVKPQ